VLVDPFRVGYEDRLRLLEHMVERLGASRAAEALGVSKRTFYRMLRGEAPIDDSRLEKILSAIPAEEALEVLGARKRLEACGAIEGGRVVRGVVLEILRLASEDPVLRELVLRFAVENMAEDLRKELSIEPPRVVLRWEPGFEEFMRERKKGRKVVSGETIRYYRSLFSKYLEGRELSRELADEVASHSNKWLRVVFRHYIRYLFYRRRIPAESYGWLLEAVPSRTYKLDVRPYPIPREELRRTLETLRGEHALYYTLYRLMLEGGLRLGHALALIASWRPGEVVEVPGVGIETPRLVCFEERGFCRYYLGIRGPQKPCEWAYFSAELLGLIKAVAGRRVARNNVHKFTKRRGLLAPKMMRKAAWRLMVRAMPREVARFIQSRFGELTVSEARYEDLLTEADQHYPSYLGLVKV